MKINPKNPIILCAKKIDFTLKQEMFLKKTNGVGLKRENITQG